MAWGQDAGLKAVMSQDSPLGPIPNPVLPGSSRASRIPPHRCPKEMGPHVPSVTSLCLQYIKHDPNYNYDSDGEEEQMETEDSEFSEQGEWPTCPWAGGWKWVQPSRESPSQRQGPHLVPPSCSQLFLRLQPCPWKSGSSVVPTLSDCTDHKIVVIAVVY